MLDSPPACDVVLELRSDDSSWFGLGEEIDPVMTIEADAKHDHLLVSDVAIGLVLATKTASEVRWLSRAANMTA